MKKTLPLIIIFISLIVMWSIYGKIVNPDRNSTAVGGEYKVEIDEQALVIRNETPISVSGEGYFQNIAKSETKVWLGEAVGWFCKGDPDVDIIKQLNVINQKIREAEMTESTDKALTNDIFSIDNKILALTKQVSALAASGNQKELGEIRNEIDLLLERKNNIQNNSSGSKETVLDTLYRQKKELESQLGYAKQTLTAPKSGIFVGQADGLEQTLNFESVTTLTPASVKEYLGREEYKPEEEIYPYPVCKITDNTGWLLATVCSEEVAAEVSEGKRIRVSFPDDGDKTLVCSVYKKSEPEKGKVVLYILGTHEIYNILTERRIRINVVLDSYEGLRIPKDAVKTVEGKDVVTVKKAGGDIQVEVEVLFKDESFAIIKEGGELKMYDKVKTN